MKILGIDTIVHDVCAAVMEDRRVLSNEKRSTPMPLINQSLLSLTAIHVREMGEVLEAALQKANVSMDSISLIAANNTGSLLSNVLIGLLTANTLSRIRNIPIVNVGHQEGHIFSNWIERDAAHFNFPILVLSASGGHTLVALIAENNFRYKIISENRGIKDRSGFRPEFVGLGFLFSEIVSELGLVNSQERVNGDGNFIAQLAAKGDARKFNFSLPAEKDKPPGQFNYKKLMQAVRSTIKRQRRKDRKLPNEFICDIAASFQDSLSEGIICALYKLANDFKAKEIHLAGGVSANEVIRDKLAKKLEMTGIIGRYPAAKSYCTDNAAMIASLGYYKFMQNPEQYVQQRCLDIKSDLVLERLAIEQFIKSNRVLG